MAWHSNLGRKCLRHDCDDWHDLYWPEDEIPSMNSDYVYMCPTAKRWVQFRPREAWDESSECPDGASVVAEFLKLPVDKLAPGEPVLTAESIAFAVKELEDGVVSPITVFEDGSRYIVRDGNKRVRAWIQHHKVRDDMHCAVSKHKLTVDALDEYRLPADAHGVGTQAFEDLAVVSEAEFGAVHNRKITELRERRDSGNTGC